MCTKPLRGSHFQTRVRTGIERSFFSSFAFPTSLFPHPVSPHTSRRLMPLLFFCRLDQQFNFSSIAPIIFFFPRSMMRIPRPLNPSFFISFFHPFFFFFAFEECNPRLVLSPERNVLSWKRVFLAKSTCVQLPLGGLFTWDRPCPSFSLCPTVPRCRSTKVLIAYSPTCLSTYRAVNPPPPPLVTRDQSARWKAFSIFTFRIDRPLPPAFLHLLWYHVAALSLSKGRGLGQLGEGSFFLDSSFVTSVTSNHRPLGDPPFPFHLLFPLFFFLARLSSNSCLFLRVSMRTLLFH